MDREDQEFARALIALSRKVGLTLAELGEMARDIVSAQIDPIQAGGPRFVFESKRPGPRDLEDYQDLLFINRDIPEVDDDVNLLDCFEEYKRDVERCCDRLKERPDVDGLLRIMDNLLRWIRFWAVRHPKEEMRAQYRETEAKVREAARPFYEKTVAQLERAGVRLISLN